MVPDFVFSLIFIFYVNIFSISECSVTVAFPPEADDPDQNVLHIHIEK